MCMCMCVGVAVVKDDGSEFQREIVDGRTNIYMYVQAWSFDLWMTSIWMSEVLEIYTDSH